VFEKLRESWLLESAQREKTLFFLEALEKTLQ
jgi:hypothetical protein